MEVEHTNSTMFISYVLETLASLQLQLYYSDIHFEVTNVKYLIPAATYSSSSILQFLELHCMVIIILSITQFVACSPFFFCSSVVLHVDGCRKAVRQKTGKVWYYPSRD